MTDEVEYKVNRDMEKAPKDRPILGYCVHGADRYFDEEQDRLTVYGAHCEGLCHVPDGWHVLVWGGERYDDYCIPEYWFRDGSGFEEAANPVAWMEIPAVDDIARFRALAGGEEG